MERTVQLTIPARWLEELSIDQDELRRAVMLGLTQLRQQREERDISDRTIQALLDTGLVHHLSVPLPEGIEPAAERQAPPTLPAPSASEIIIAQRRGES
jgi:hypothetical protein